MTRAAVKTNIDRDIAAGIQGGIRATTHNARLKEVLDESLNIADDTTDNITEGTTKKFASRDNVFALIETNSKITKKGNLIEFDIPDAGSGGGTTYDDGAIELETLGTVTGGSQWRQLRTVHTTGNTVVRVPASGETGFNEGGFLIRSGDFWAEVPFTDINDLPVNATNDTTADTSGSTQNAILLRSAGVRASTGDYSAVYVGMTSARVLLVAANMNNGNSSDDVTDELKIWLLDHAHRGTFHRDDDTETTIADADKIGFFDNSESFQPPKTITFANFKGALNIPAGGGSFSFPSSAETTLQDTDEFLFQDDSDSDTLKAITVMSLKTALGISSGTAPTPAAHEMAFTGAQNSNSFTGYQTSSASQSFDVQNATYSFTTDITVPAQNWGYILVPENREPDSIIGFQGNNVLSSFTKVQDVFQIGTQDYTAYYFQNLGRQSTARYIVSKS